MLIDIYMKIREDSLNHFQVTERTFCDGQSSMGNNSKSIKARVMVAALCIREDSLNGFQVTERTRVDRQADAGRINNVFPNPKGGDIMLL